MYVRHRAWLSAVPDTNTRNKRNERTRYELLKDKNSELLNLPEVNYAEYLIDYLFEVGPSMSNGMGLCPISYQEISSWLQTTKTECNSWDVNVIRHLSKVFINQYHESIKVDCPPPYHYMVENNMEEIRKGIDDKIKSVFANKIKKRE